MGRNTSPLGKRGHGERLYFLLPSPLLDCFHCRTQKDVIAADISRACIPGKETSDVHIAKGGENEKSRYRFICSERCFSFCKKRGNMRKVVEKMLCMKNNETKARCLSYDKVMIRKEEARVFGYPLETVYLAILIVSGSLTLLYIFFSDVDRKSVV